MTVNVGFRESVPGYHIKEMDSAIEVQERTLYLQALDALSDAGIPFMLGGAFAVYHYTRWWRNTHDVDA